MSDREFLELLLNELKWIKRDINNLDIKFENLQTQVDTISKEVIGIKLTLEYTTNKNINLLVDGYNNAEEKLENHETRIIKLERVAI